MTGAQHVVDGSLVLDADNPWPGLDSFDEQGRDYFHGRDDEAAALLRRVTDASVSVLFGKSGLGKTSLLKAGLFPRLRQQHYLPIYVRLAIRPDAPPLLEQVCQSMRAAFASERVDAPSWLPEQSLWEFLHRRDFELWSSHNFQLVPIIVFDQFEELFTLGEAVPQAVARFKIELADLAENRIPEAIATRMASDTALAAAIDVRAMPARFVISLREDFLPDLEGWRRAMPSLGRTRLRLLPMRLEQAMAAVHETAPQLMDETMARRIVEFVAAAQVSQNEIESEAPDLIPRPTHHAEIEPALLSLFCRGLNDRRKRAGQARFDADLIEGAKQGIISDYYRSCVDGLPDSGSRFIENELITEKGFRNSYSRDDAVPVHLTAEQLDYLITRRLLRIEERHGTERIELTHDLLTRAVLEHRTQRRQQDREEERTREAKVERDRLEKESHRQNARFRVAAAVAGACLLLAALALYQWRVAALERQRADEALKQSQARDLASQSQLVGATDPIRSLDFALSAIDVKETPQSALALRLAFARARLRAVVSPPPGKFYTGGDVSPAGDRIALVRRDGAIDIRALPSLQLLHSRPGTSDSRIPSAYFTADGSELVVVVSGEGVTRWNPVTGQNSRLFNDPGLSGGYPGEDRDLLLMYTNDQLRSLRLSTGVAAPLPRCTESGTTLATTLTKSGIVAVLPDGVCIGRRRRAFAEGEHLDSAGLSPDGSSIATWDKQDEIVRIWDVATARQVVPIQGFTAVPSWISLIGPRHVVIGVYDRTVELWKVPAVGSGEGPDRIAQFTGPTEAVVAAYGAQNGRWVITLDIPGAVHVWQGLSNQPRDRVVFGTAASSVVSNARDALAMIIDGRLLRTSKGARRQELSSRQQTSNAPPLVVSRSHDRSHALTAWFNGWVQVWGLDDGRLVGEFREERPLLAASWVTPGCRVATPSPAGESSRDDACAVATIDIDRRVRVHTVGGHQPLVRSWALPSGVGVEGTISRDRQQWVEESAGGLTFTHLGTGTVKVVKLTGKPVGGWRFGQDTRSVLTKDYWSVYRESLAPGGESRQLRGHSAGITGATLSPDGRRVLTTSEDWTARLWDASTGALLNTLRGHVSGIAHAIFNRDGSLVATTSRDNTLRVWDTASGTQVFRYELGADAGGTIDDFHGPLVVYRPKAQDTALVIECEPCLPLADLRRLGRERVKVLVP